SSGSVPGAAPGSPGASRPSTARKTNIRTPPTLPPSVPSVASPLSEFGRFVPDPLFLIPPHQHRVQVIPGHLLQPESVQDREPGVLIVQFAASQQPPHVLEVGHLAGPTQALPPDQVLVHGQR